MRRLSPFGIFLAIVMPASACSMDDGAAPAPPPGDTSAPPPGDPPDAGAPSPETTVAVAHERELRGAWISTVYNGTWPSATGLSQAASQAELLTIFDALAAANMNAVFLQVRPESDALYASALEPWSRFLTGTQGTSPGWDPLAFAVDEGHKRGLEVHAWINPYRGLVNATSQVDPLHPTKTLASHTIKYGTQAWMDPGAPEVRAHILDVIRDILTRYDVDGLHFDDYFYPYPIDGQTFDDAATYAAFAAGGGALSRDDFRRANVDALVQQTAELVATTRSDVRFGISPFGIYRPGTPAGITGLDAYASLYCDPVRWMKEGWVDYLAPQLYWPTTRTAQAFGKLVTWWASLSENGQSIFVGHDATKIGTTDWPLSEYEDQMSLAHAERSRGVTGSIFFTANPLVEDTGGLRSSLVANHWASRALTPPLASALGASIPAPSVASRDDDVVVSTSTPLRAIVVYRPDGAGFAVDELIAATPASTTVTLEPGAWVISVVDRRGVESRGVPLTIDAP